jgi:hypothetical protein
MSVCYACCVLSGRGLCDELITRLKESYQLWCVFVWDLDLDLNLSAKKIVQFLFLTYFIVSGKHIKDVSKTLPLSSYVKRRRRIYSGVPFRKK